MKFISDDDTICTTEAEALSRDHAYKKAIVLLRIFGFPALSLNAQRLVTLHMKGLIDLKPFVQIPEEL